jgi:hypothetical protein
VLAVHKDTQDAFLHPFSCRWAAPFPSSLLHPRSAMGITVSSTIECSKIGPGPGQCDQYLQSKVCSLPRWSCPYRWQLTSALHSWEIGTLAEALTARVEAARSICTSLYPTTCVSRTRRGCRCYVNRQDVSIASLLPYLWGKIGHYAEVASFRVVVRKQPGMLPLINGAGASAIGDPASKSISAS